jgi:uncharacterized protein YndB with AHSA1/START domain
MTTDPYRGSVHIEAPPERVFEMFTKPEQILRWMGVRAVLDPRPGGEFRLYISGVPVVGRYLEVDPPRRVVISWGREGLRASHPGRARWKSRSRQSRMAPWLGSSTAVSPRPSGANMRSGGPTTCPGSRSRRWAATLRPTRGNDPCRKPSGPATSPRFRLRELIGRLARRQILG